MSPFQTSSQHCILSISQESSFHVQHTHRECQGRGAHMQNQCLHGVITGRSYWLKQIAQSSGGAIRSCCTSIVPFCPSVFSIGLGSCGTVRSCPCMPMRISSDQIAFSM